MRPTVEPVTLLYSSLAYLVGHLSILSPYVEVDTVYGRLRGAKTVSRTGRTYIEFLGIPFAKPPLGNLRFEPPEPPYKWRGVRDATNYGRNCLQYEFLTHFLSGSEDCLNLNVYTHQTLREDELENAKLKPVIVYFYGGLFMSGFSYLYRGKYFMDEDVVLVTLNYRVASFGFLDTQDGIIRGNMGLKDQVMALRWVQANIKYFGGDPKLVTLMGQSAGASSVHYHMLSKMSTGLFHRAISQSGSTLQVWAFQDRPRMQVARLANGVGCYTTNTTKMVACLKSVPAKAIARFHREYLEPLPDPLSVYPPTAEAVTDDKTFISESPLELLRKGKIVNQVPWIVGVTNGEGLLGAGYLFKKPQQLDQLNNNWTAIAPLILDYMDNDNKDNISARIHDFYFHKRGGPADFSEISEFYSDSAMYWGMHDAVYLQSLSTTSPIYSYYFTYQGNSGLGNILDRMLGGLPRIVDFLIGTSRRWFTGRLDRSSIKDLGVAHSDDLVFLFNLPVVADEITPGSEDYRFSNELVKLWTSFARDGKPGLFFGKQWEPMTADQNGALSVFEIGNFPKMITEPYKTGVDFWNSLNLDTHHTN